MVAGLALGAALLLAPLDAAACSCGPVDPWRAYARSDAAFVGVFLGKRGPTTYAFRVEEDYKADLGPVVEVSAPESGASCGLELPVGRRTGLFLSRRLGSWESNLCSQARPGQVRIAARGLPKPDGKGPIRFLVGGSFGPARAQALDAQGRTLAYGRGRGTVASIAICPGSRRSVELASNRDGGLKAWVATRDLRTFELIREITVRRSAYEYPAGIHCVGRDVFVSLIAGEVGRLVRVRGRSVTTIRKGLIGPPSFSGPFAYAADRSSILRVDLRTGQARQLADFGADALAVNRDRTWLAALASSRLVLVRLGQRLRVVRGPSLQNDAVRRLVWDGRLLAVLGDTGRIYDTSFQLRGRLPAWYVVDAVGLGGRIAGVGAGLLSSARLPSGPVRLLRDLLSPETYAIAAVDGGPEIKLAGTLLCARG